MTRIYQVRKHGQLVDRIDNLGSDFGISITEVDFRDKYALKCLLHESEKNVLWHVAKGVNGDIANLGHAVGGSASVMGAALKFTNKPYTEHSIDTFSEGKLEARIVDLKTAGWITRPPGSPPGRPSGETTSIGALESSIRPATGCCR